MASEKKVEPYAFTPAFERQVVLLTCTQPKFFGVIGYALDAPAMPTPAAALAVQTAQAIARDLGSGPARAVLVVQRLRSLMAEGKVTAEKLQAVADLLDTAEDEGVMPSEAVVAEVAPILKRRVQQETVRVAMDEYAKRGDFGKVIDMVSRAQRIGQHDTSLGVKVGGSSFQVIDSVRHLERLPTGILELDAILSGGVPRGQEAMFIGGPGDGKSMALGHVCAHAWMHGLFCGYVSLELPDHVVLARLKANATGETIDSILEGNSKAKEKLEQMPLGTCIVKSFTPMATTVNDLSDWVKQCEDAEGRSMELLVVDYADKMTGRVSKRDNNGDGMYMGALEVYEGLRIWADQRKTWVWTASQATRPNKDSKKKLDLEHTADSMHKVRVADLVITLNARDDATAMLYWIAKNRTGRSRVSVGPLPVDFPTAQMAPVIRPDASPEPVRSSDSENGELF